MNNEGFDIFWNTRAKLMLADVVFPIELQEPLRRVVEASFESGMSKSQLEYQRGYAEGFKRCKCEYKL